MINPEHQAELQYVMDHVFLEDQLASARDMNAILVAIMLLWIGGVLLGKLRRRKRVVQTPLKRPRVSS